MNLIIETNLTKQHYIKIQRDTKRRRTNIYPAYSVISEVKKSSYPNNIRISENGPAIPLQVLLNLIIRHLFEVQSELFLLHLQHKVAQIDVHYKWGLNDRGGHSKYKDTFINNPKYSDSNIIISTIIPLKSQLCTETKSLYSERT